jgi:hypothetical protein
MDGGMGNQLFQYAVGKYLAEKHGVELKLDVDSYIGNKNRQYSLHHFAVKEVFCSRKDKKTLERKEYISRQLRKLGFSIKPYWCTEQNPGYHDYVQRLNSNVYLEGFWQSEKYFKAIENIIRKEFIVKESPSDLNKCYLDKIRSANAVSIHVRRGDYISDEVTHAVHGVCGLDYYREAINLMMAGVDDPQFFIFSDDMEWTKANLSIDRYPVTYIDNNTTADYEDIRLMSSCKHHIIANSSFSWWGAWLNDYGGKKVIAPKKWFRSLLTNDDIIPDGWQAI